MIRMIQRVEYKIQTKYKGYRLLAKDLRHGAPQVNGQQPSLLYGQEERLVLPVEK